MSVLLCIHVTDRSWHLSRLPITYVYPGLSFMRSFALTTSKEDQNKQFSWITLVPRGSIDGSNTFCLCEVAITHSNQCLGIRSFGSSAGPKPDCKSIHMWYVGAGHLYDLCNASGHSTHLRLQQPFTEWVYPQISTSKLQVSLRPVSMKLPVFYVQIVANKADLMRVQGEGDEENGESLELGCTVGGHGA